MLNKIYDWFKRIFSRPKYDKAVHKTLIKDVLTELDKPEQEPEPEAEEMPKELEDLVSKLKREGKSEDAAWAIATAALQKAGKLKKGKRKKK